MHDVALWRAFLAAYRAGSVSGAARILDLAQSTVTAQLQAVERVAGGPLFVRHPRGIRPTPLADEAAARLAGPFDAVAVALGTRPHAEHPPLRLGGAAEFLERIALPALAPHIGDGMRISVIAGLADDLLAELGAGGLDLVISAVRPRGRRLPSSPLADEEFVLVASPALDLDAGSVTDPRSLDNVPMLAYAHDVPILRRYWRHVFHQRLERRPALVAPDLRALTAAAVAGAGFTVLPSYLIREELAARALIALHETDDPPINTLYLVRRPGAPVDAVAAVETALRDAARTL